MVCKQKKYHWKNRHRIFRRNELMRHLEDAYLYGTSMLHITNVELSSIVQGNLTVRVATAPPDTTRSEKEGGTTSPPKTS